MKRSRRSWSAFGRGGRTAIPSCAPRRRRDSIGSRRCHTSGAKPGRALGKSLPGPSRYIPATTLCVVLARFGVESPIDIEPHEASKRNDNFVVVGPDAKYLLRRYRRNNDE